MSMGKQLHRSLYYSISLIFCLAVLLLLSSCGVTSSSTVRFKIANPYEGVLTTADIKELKVDTICTGSTVEEISNQIMLWQNTYMIMRSPTQNPDVSYAMRWNKVMPGIYPIDDLVYEKRVTDNSISKIYGVCWDYAAVYFAIASYYGLDVRMTALDKYGTEHGVYPTRNIPEKGMSPTPEFSAFEPKLIDNGLSFTVDDFQNSPLETYAHYRVEVWISPNWVSKDATYPTGEWANDSNYVVDAWNSHYDTNLAY